jgi:hypothetical protein
LNIGGKWYILCMWKVVSPGNESGWFICMELVRYGWSACWIITESKLECHLPSISSCESLCVKCQHSQLCGKPLIFATSFLPSHISTCAQFHTCSLGSPGFLLPCFELPVQCNLKWDGRKGRSLLIPIVARFLSNVVHFYIKSQRVTELTVCISRHQFAQRTAQGLCQCITDSLEEPAMLRDRAESLGLSVIAAVFRLAGRYKIWDSISSICL